MQEPLKILIADRNRHVREFLQREFTACGYAVDVAGDGREVLSKLAHPPDLLILDLEIPLIDGMQLLEVLRTSIPRLPVIIHSFLEEHLNQPLLSSAAALVEKAGDTDCLKRTVSDVMQQYYPEMFVSSAGPALPG
ncbi:MAG: hypothetical protein QG577_2544 [Thermodesulfobacteriota bacterium]|nr:hypothetical protein [Thermodesulfobacteriota bacterium]